MELPAGWAWATLESLLSAEPRAITDGPFGSNLKSAHYTDEGARVLRLQNVGDGFFRDELAYISLKHFETLRNHEVVEGDLILASLGEVLPRVAIVPKLGGPAIVKADVIRARIHESVSTKWVLYTLLSPQIRRYTTSRIKGVGRPRLGLGEIRKLPIPVPPLAEQHRIVEALEGHLSRLDSATNSMATAKRHIKPFTASVLDRTVLGTSLTTTSNPGAVDSSQRLLAGLSSKRFNYAALPPLPAGWFWRRASDVCEFISSGSTPKPHLMHAGQGDVPFLKVYNITQDGKVDFTNKPTYVDFETHEGQLRRSRVRPGDVLTNIVGPPLGKTAVVPDQYPEWNINQAIVAFRAGPEVRSEWLSLALRAPFVLNMLQKTAKATAGQFNVALSTCRELPLPIPPIDAQLDLVAQSAELLEVSDRFTSQVAVTSLRSRHLRQAVLGRAFTGKLVPQDPADEPAPVLLDRIRADHEAQGKPKRAVRRPRKAAATADAPPPPPASSSPSSINAVQQELPL